MGKQQFLSLYKRIFLQVRPHWIYLSLFFLLGLLSTPIALLMPLPLKIAVDSVIGSHPLPGFLGRLWPVETTSKGVILAVVAGMLLLFSTMRLLQNLGAWLLGEYNGERMVLDFRSRLFHHVQRLSLAYHDSRGLSDATYRVQWDAPAIHWLLTYSFIPFVNAALMLVASIYVTARISLKLSVVALAVSPILVFLIWLYGKRLQKRWERVKELETSALSVIQEVLGAIRVVKAFRQEERELDRFVRRSTSGLWARVRVVFAESSLSFFVGLTFALGTAAVLLIGIGQVLQGTLTLGSFLLVMAYLGQLYDPLHTIGRQIAAQQGHLVGIRRAFALLDQAPAVEERRGVRPLGRAKGEVVFRDVSFSYPAGNCALHNISLEVPAGSRVGLSGATGAGKTTFISLLIRFYDPQRGQILLDGVDLRDYRLDDLRNQFAIVLQEPVLFSGSIADNIAYASPEAGMDAIVEAARAANAHDFIMSLPRGYDTEVGIRGMSLSGGERQRIALARAFLKDAPMLILDEPTSSVDYETEGSIMEAMKRLSTGRTSFIISHRTGTLDGCDVRIALENGKLLANTSCRLDWRS
jgi:ATP-binding cassette subfamily B protein